MSFQCADSEFLMSQVIHDLLTSPAVTSRISLLASRKVSSSTLKPGDTLERAQARIARGLEGVARTMAGELAAKIERPKLISFYCVVLQNLFARLYHAGVHVNIEEIVRVSLSLFSYHGKATARASIPSLYLSLPYLSMTTS